MGSSYGGPIAAMIAIDHRKNFIMCCAGSSYGSGKEKILVV